MADTPVEKCFKDIVDKIGVELTPFTHDWIRRDLEILFLEGRNAGIADAKECLSR